MCGASKRSSVRTMQRSNRKARLRELRAANRHENRAAPNFRSCSSSEHASTKHTQTHEMDVNSHLIRSSVEKTSTYTGAAATVGRARKGPEPRGASCSHGSSVATSRWLRRRQSTRAPSGSLRASSETRVISRADRTGKPSIIQQRTRGSRAWLPCQRRQTMASPESARNHPRPNPTTLRHSRQHHQLRWPLPHRSTPACRCLCRLRRHRPCHQPLRRRLRCPLAWSDRSVAYRCPPAGAFMADRSWSGAT
jgi:hypothetical protein